jgi:hypothetical protein
MRYEVVTQPSSTASMEYDRPIAGRAMLTDEPMNGVTNAVTEATRSTPRPSSLRWGSWRRGSCRPEVRTPFPSSSLACTSPP